MRFISGCDDGPRMRFSTILAVLAAIVAVGSAAASLPPPPPKWVLHGRYSPTIDPANFVGRIDNRYFPLLPGTGFHYQGVRGSTTQTDDTIVTGQTTYIQDLTLARG